MIYHTAAALLASGLVASVSAAGHGHAHHNKLHERKAEASSIVEPASANSTCGCTTYTTTWYGPAGLVPDKPTPTPEISSAAPTTSSSSETPTTSSLSTSTISSVAPTTSTSTSSSSASPTSTSSTVESTTPSSSSTWVAPTTSSSETPTSTWVAPTTSTTPTSIWVAPTTSSTEAAPSSTWVAPTSIWVAPTTSSTEAAPSSTWVAPTTSESSTWVAPTTSESSTWAAPSSYSAPESSSVAGGWADKLNLPSISIPVIGGWGASSSAAAAPSPSSYSSGSSSGSAGTIAPSGNKWAMTYTPYNNDGSCKSASDVSSDISSIAGKGFNTVRLYATDCSGPQNVGSACKANGLKLILGIYIDGSGLGDNAYAQVSTLISWGSAGNWDMVEMVVAGNEAIFNGFCSASALAGFITNVKSKFRSAGYSGPITTTEPLGTIQTNAGTICPVVDVIAANIHPFFNGGIAALGAGAFVKSQLGDLSDACNGAKEAYNLETGWPWKGNSNSAALPGVIEQQVAIASIVAVAGDKSVIFSFENDGWKAPGALDVEQYWGCANLFSG